MQNDVEVIQIQPNIPNYQIEQITANHTKSSELIPAKSPKYCVRPCAVDSEKSLKDAKTRARPRWAKATAKLQSSCMTGPGDMNWCQCVCVCDTSWHSYLKLSFDVVRLSLISEKAFIWDLPTVMANASQGANTQTHTHSVYKYTSVIIYNIFYYILLSYYDILWSILYVLCVPLQEMTT